MPLRSMTGYGHGKSAGARFRAEARVRSLNHRALEVFISLDGPFPALERDVRARVERAVSRGKLDVSLRIEPAGEPAYRLSLRRGVVEAWLREAGALRRDLGLKDDAEALFMEALRVPGAVEAAPVETEMAEGDKADILRALDVALEEALAMKLTEGGALALDFSSRLDSMEKAVDAIAGRADGMLRYYADKLAQRMREWTQTAGFELDEERLLREAALYAERSDIAEELTRMRSHLAQFRALLASSETASGRSLDFLIQEMHREANTLAVKARLDDITPFALQLRSDVEKLREQVRNVE